MPRPRLLILILATVVSLGACTASGGAPVADTDPTSATVTTEAGGLEAFADVSTPAAVTLDSTSGTDAAPCRNYTSSAPPATIVLGFADALSAEGWTIGATSKSGYTYADTSGLTATKDTRRITVSASGVSSNSSSVTACIETA